MKTRLRQTVIAAVLLFDLCAARAHNGGASDASAVSMLPIAISVVAPVVVLSAGVTLTVVAVEASANGTAWVLERASDGARMSVRLGAAAAGGLLLSAGAAVTVSVVGAGWVLSAAGRAIAFIPNEIGAALLYNERVTR